jgi:S1-C subfamily serine protease
MTLASGRVSKAQPPGSYPPGAIGPYGWIDGYGMNVRTVWMGRTPVLQITRIVQYAPAARFGLEVGDCIVQLNGYRTATPSDFVRALDFKNGADRMVVRDVRTGRWVVVIADWDRLPLG